MDSSVLCLIGQYVPVTASLALLCPSLLCFLQEDGAWMCQCCPLQQQQRYVQGICASKKRAASLIP